LSMKPGRCRERPTGMTTPIVTVAICLHNGSRYIVETLDTVFAQSFQDFEIVIVDDGSTDDSVDLIGRHFRDSRLRIVRQRNQTLRVARPVAVAHARGEFIAFLDHDDLWLPHKLQEQIAHGRERPDAALIFSDCLIVDSAGHTIGQLSDQYDFRDIDLSGTRGYLELLRRGCFVAYPTALARTAAVRAVGGFDSKYQYVSDYDLWLRLARRSPIRCIYEPLAKYRVHEIQFTQRHSDITLAEHNALLRPIVNSASYPADLRAIIGHNLFGQHRVAFGLLWRQRRVRPALRAIIGSLRYPTPLRHYCLYRLSRNRAGQAFRRPGKYIVRAAGRAVSRRTSGAGQGSGGRAEGSETPPVVWIDGSCLGREQTGYFSLLGELIRQTARRAGTEVHVVTSRAGRVALSQRLGSDVATVRFHRSGWRSVHWSDVYRLLFGPHGHILVALAVVLLTALTVTTGNAVAGVAAIVFASIQAAVIVDELAARWADANGRSRQRCFARLVRFAWRRVPAPWKRAPSSNTVEVLFWRGRFQWRDATRIAFVQDLTPKIHPELHTPGNVAEFDEFLGYVHRHAHVVATLSENTRIDIVDRTRICPESVSVIPVPVHPQFEDPQFSDGFVTAHGVATPYVLAVGTLEPRKNLRRLVKAFELLENEPAASGHTLVLVGPQGWDPAFREFLVGSDAYARVQVVGFVPTEHLPSLYHFASAVIYPSLYEGFGLPVLEAMCSSAIVLASRISSIPEVLGEDGLFFNPYDTEDMARALLRALELSPADANRHRGSCRRRAEAHLGRVNRAGVLPGIHGRQAPAAVM
jgi:glycosyltransferase involved in cell wall biosynthesis/GT2 family glycosyltransferase